MILCWEGGWSVAWSMARPNKPVRVLLKGVQVLAGYEEPGGDVAL